MKTVKDKLEELKDKICFVQFFNKEELSIIKLLDYSDGFFLFLEIDEIEKLVNRDLVDSIFLANEEAIDKYNNYHEKWINDNNFKGDNENPYLIKRIKK